MILELDASVYPTDVIEAASYRFIDKFSVVISPSAEINIVEISFDNDSNKEQLTQLFKKELVDQKLRKRIRSETEQVRNLVIAYAFSRSELDV